MANVIDHVDIVVSDLSAAALEPADARRRLEA
jgi:hypothetical protein